MELAEARTEIDALPYIGYERIAFNALLETAQRDPEASREAVRIFLRGIGADDTNLNTKTAAFYVLATCTADPLQEAH